MKRAVLVAAICAIPYVAAQQPVYSQCGGIGYTGSTTCVAGTICQHWSDYYYQCIPGTSTTTSTASTSTSTITPSKPTTTGTTTTTSQTTTTSTTTTINAAATGFVTVSGQKFILNGETYSVAGTNAYWLAQQGDADIDTALSDIANAGLTTVRTWGFNDVTAVQSYGAYYQLWSNGVATFNTGDYGISRFDSVVATAKKYGLKLIVALTNNWSDYGGMDVYVSQLNSGSTHDTFYTNPTIIAAYKNYISEFVGRYANESTILAWELANEPRCTGSSGGTPTDCDSAGTTIYNWATEISAYIKSIDSNHLVGLGDEGWFQWASPPTYPYAPGVGIDFELNLQISTLDFGTFHSYPESWGQSANESLWGVQWIADHAAAQKTANKPVLLEEFGVTTSQVDIYTGWYNEIISSGLTGDLIWQAGSYLSYGASWDDGYAVYPNSTDYPVVVSGATALKARG